MAKTLFKGKNIFVTDSSKNNDALKGEPNTNIDFRKKSNGEIVRRRKLDENGNAYKDMEFAGGHCGKDHINEPVLMPRKHRPPNKKEQKEMDKARRKRELWQ